MILGVESSCDESALALFDPARGLVGEWMHSQVALHQAYGGVVPDLASREHLDRFPALLAAAAASSGYARLGRIAVTRGPGLAGCLAVGLALGQALALARGVPLAGVNHLRGHAWSVFLPLHGRDPARFLDRLAPLLPHLGLLVSGGNTILYFLESGGRVTVVNRTLDDAAGEALDKGAKLLGLPYPGGPLIEKLAAGGDARRFDFPRALGEGGGAAAPFSFSGLKTSLRYRLEKMPAPEIAAARADLCAGYQAAVVEQLVEKTERTIRDGAVVRSLGLSGGVANNGPLRAAFSDLAARCGLPLFVAEPRHTGDNAAMIAFAAWADAGHTEVDTPKSPLSFDPALTL